MKIKAFGVMSENPKNYASKYIVASVTNLLK